MAGACLLLPIFHAPAGAGTTGKISGRVVDRAKQPLAGVNIAIPAARLGAVTDADGRYVILNLPAGRYEVRLGLIGYRATTVTDVVVSSDQTTRLDQTLQEAPVEMGEIVVSAQRPVVDLNRTSTMATVDRQQIQNLPVQELQEVVNLQAGVVDGHFRGGRKGEVQFQVDGVTVNNVYDNTSTLRLDRSLIEEVQVISGTFDAEYGQAMSGVVNAVLRRGTNRFELGGEALGGGFYYKGARRGVDYDLRPLTTHNFQLSASGPTGLPKTTFLASARDYSFDDWVYGIRVFRPDDSVVEGGRGPTGDQDEVALGWSRERSGLVKLSNQSLHNIDLNYQAVYNHVDARTADFAYYVNPDGLSRKTTESLVHGIDWTHTVGKKSFYTVSARHNWFNYRDRAYDDLYDPRYPTESPFRFEGFSLTGVQTTRFRQKTNSFVLKGAYVNQYSPDLQLKVGGELQLPIMSFGQMGYVLARIDSTTGESGFIRLVRDPPYYPGELKYYPVLGAAFAQEDVEWNDLRVRAGLRFEYFDARTTLPSNLKNPANALPPPVPQSVPVRTTTKISIAPRLGVSYPVTKDAALFFAYGHFYQMPALGTAFNDADYGVLATLQGGTSSYRVLGNPDIRPERTVHYQFGYKQALTEWLGLEVSTFYKDIRDLLGVEFISTYNDAEFSRLTNVDFGGVTGFTIALDQRQRGLFSSSVDYTWQVAQGNSSEPGETATRAQAGEDPRPRQVPLDWDQRHTLNLTVIMSQPDNFAASTVVRVASGQPYTPNISTHGGGLEKNSGRKPLSMVVDLRGEKHLGLLGLDLSLFGRVFNVFDTRYFNGAVFASTGSPYYSRDESTDRFQLANPTRYYAPRRIEFGLSFQMGKT